MAATRRGRSLPDPSRVEKGPGGQDSVEVRAVVATALARSGRGVLESICDAHLDLGGRILASYLAHGSVRPAWRPQH